jgi:RNA polymerase sigma-70 factor (ECF subfamily)
MDSSLAAISVNSLPLPEASVVDGDSSSSSTSSETVTAVFTTRLAAGDEGAFREFHAAYFDRLYAFLLVVTRGREDEAQEALQQTMLRVLKYARAFDSEDAFWSWLKVLARSAARDAGRKQQRYSSLLQDFASRWLQQRQEAPLDEYNDLFAALEESLDKLAPEDCILLRRKYLEGSTIKELATDCGATERAVESYPGG